ncbi:MAG: NADP-dependent phosphogluconate dehydrogenase [Opitutae bacterium]|tara:strand:- start:1202 stop:2707 length:1506 start_codon:yes stop_codon:yes gene_type:complete
MTDSTSDIGLIGLAVMGQNLALNIADHNYKISVYNRTFSKTEDFLKKNARDLPNLTGYENLKLFVNSLQSPKKIIIMVQAGNSTDAVIESLIPLLGKGDVIIDGGNAKWTDSISRERMLKDKNILFVGSGVSGGEEGARYGPSLMPGGSMEAWSLIKPIWDSISAKVNPETGKPLEGASPGNPISGGVPCSAYIGNDGAGHYVKMVHNGIEYGDMQMICEAYHLMTSIVNLSPLEIGDIFNEWNNGELDSFLIEITGDILKQKDPRTNEPFVDIVLDAAGQKGTGKWTSVNALDMGVPAPTVSEAVFARCLSAVKEERVAASNILSGPSVKIISDNKQVLVSAIRDALYCSKICSYAQGFQLMREAQKEYNWTLNFGEIAKIWRGGCIIRAAFLQKITEAYIKDPNLANLLLDDYFKECLDIYQSSWRKVISLAIESGIPVPTFSSAIAYYDGYRSERLPQNLLQAQRDYFGAHTYERTDEARGKFFHLDWLHPNRPENLI